MEKQLRKMRKTSEVDSGLHVVFTHTWVHTDTQRHGKTYRGRWALQQVTLVFTLEIPNQNKKRTEVGIGPRPLSFTLEEGLEENRQAWGTDGIRSQQGLFPGR